MRSIIRGFTLAAAVFAFGTLAANAQINYAAEVNIPFEFNVGEHAYGAGRYTVKLNRQILGGVALTVQKGRADKIQTILLGSGGGSRSGEVQLVFNSLDGRRFLTGITTSNEAYSVFQEKNLETKLAELQKAKSRSSKL